MTTLIDPEDFPASTKSCYLNAASVALMYRGAAKAVIDWQNDLAEYGTLKFDETAEEAVFRDLHTATAKLFNVEREDIAVGSSATELISSLAWALAPESGKNIVSTDIVFPSTIYPWARVARHTGCEVRFAQSHQGYVDPRELLELIDKNTAVVALSHVEFASGQCYDLEQMAQAAHAAGALLVVDATQSAGMLPIDAVKSGVDAMITAAYKWLCGPFGVAVMYISPHLYKDLDPGLVGWRSHYQMWDLKADRLKYPETASRFEFSTMTYGCALGLTRSMEYLLSIGLDKVFSHTRRLADMLRDGLRERGVTIISPEGDPERTAILSVQFNHRDPDEVSRFLNSKKVVVSKRGTYIRFSPHIYNDPDDVDQALNSIDQISKKR